MEGEEAKQKVALTECNPSILSHPSILSDRRQERSADQRWVSCEELARWRGLSTEDGGLFPGTAVRGVCGDGQGTGAGDGEICVSDV